ncbi:hypothetical protein [Neorhodopirellula lusitana]|uniref:hypothetical protein n=1 Tax=Neorhodopirellula lusitana TaxID=445327 RepID=UPI0024B78568|nr:hypothetical protein [Neorhodopirellula lusitana]
MQQHSTANRTGCLLNGGKTRNGSPHVRIIGMRAAYISLATRKTGTIPTTARITDTTQRTRPVSAQPIRKNPNPIRRAAQSAVLLVRIRREVLIIQWISYSIRSQGLLAKKVAQSNPHFVKLADLTSPDATQVLDDAILVSLESEFDSHEPQAARDARSDEIGSWTNDNE